VRSLIAALLLAALVVPMAPAAEQAELLPDYPLEILNIKPVGTDGMEASNRIFRAYPGLRYNIRAAVIGGRYPYSFRLTEAPDGMTVDARNGEVDWPTPRASAKAKLEVTDSAGKKITAEWTVTVTKEKFIFVDAKNGKRASEGATGTIENPFKTIADFYPNEEQKGLRTSKYTDHVVYFRAGTYKLDGFKCGWGTKWMDFRNWHPNILAGYPGEEAIIDCESKHCLTAKGQSGFCVENLRFRGMKNYGYALQLMPELGDLKYVTVRKCDFRGLGPTTGNHNQSFIRLLVGGNLTEGLVVQDCVFDGGEHLSGIKLYTCYRSLIEDNRFANFKGLDSAVALKVCVRRCVVRHNVMHGFEKGHGAVNCLFSQPYRNKFYKGISENEICYNLAYDLRSCAGLSIFAHANPGSADVYRNTLVGPVILRHVGSKAGPFRFYRNVYVREGGGGKTELRKVSDPSRIVEKENLVVNRSELNDKFLLRNEDARRKYGHWLPEPEAPKAKKGGTPKAAAAAVEKRQAASPKAAALYRAARGAERSGMKDLARTLYGRLVEEHPESPLAAEAKKRLH